MEADIVEALCYSPAIGALLEAGWDIETIYHAPLTGRVIEVLREHRVAIGKARATLRVLESREIDLTDFQWQRIAVCEDHTMLDDWLKAAETAACAADLFA